MSSPSGRRTLVGSSDVAVNSLQFTQRMAARLQMLV